MREHVINPSYGYGVRGFPTDQGFDSIGLRQLSLKPGSGEPPQWRWISQRCTAVSMTSARYHVAKATAKLFVSGCLFAMLLVLSIAGESGYGRAACHWCTTG